jgi:sugar phosphate isomerase/epimerase
MAQPLALGVMTSLSPSPLEALQNVQDLGLTSVQVGYRDEYDNEIGIRLIREAVESTGVEITTVFCGFPGESYADIPTVRATVGLVPESTRPERVERVRQIADFTAKIGVERVGAHIGFIPDDPADPQYLALVEVVRGLCDYLATLKLNFALETGQETAATLHRFIADVEENGKRTNLKVNFDPANMILYGNDEPIPATKLLAPWIDGVHCKDGNWPTEPNKLGHEVPLGEGAVHVPEWIKTLLELNYRGPLTIEREISGEEQKQDILRAKSLLEGLLPAA